MVGSWSSGRNTSQGSVSTPTRASDSSAASNGIPAAPVAVQVQSRRSVSNAPVTGASIQVELRPTAGEPVPITIDMAGEITKHNVSPGPLTAGDWQAVVVEAKADGYDGLDPASENTAKAFKVV